MHGCADGGAILLAGWGVRGHAVNGHRCEDTNESWVLRTNLGVHSQPASPACWLGCAGPRNLQCVDGVWGREVGCVCLQPTPLTRCLAVAPASATPTHKEET